MAYRSCPECNQQLVGNESSCPTCGYPLNGQRTNPINSSVNQIIPDEGDNNAENILRTWLNWLRALIIIFSIILGIGSLVGLSINGGDAGIVLGLIACIVIILLGIAVAQLEWALGMIFINISTNVRKIKQILQTR